MGMEGSHRSSSDPACSNGGPPLYAPALFEPLRARCSEDGALVEDAAAALVEVLTARPGAFVLLLGDAGAGKTFVLREVARALGATNDGPAPWLVDAYAALSRTGSRTDLTIDWILEDHFKQIGIRKSDPGEVRTALAERRAVLLLDHAEGGISVSHAEAPAALAALWRGLPPSASVVVACRTTELASRAAELEALRLAAPRFEYTRTWELQPFDREQLRRALRRRIPVEPEAAGRIAQIEGCAELSNILTQPVSLGAFAALPAEALAGREGPRLLEAYYRHTSLRPLHVEVYRQRSDTRSVALWMWAHGLDHIDGMALPETFLEQLRRRWHIAEGAAEHARTIGRTGAFTRDAAGSFSFVHPSLVDWFIASGIADEILATQGHRPLEIFGVRRMSPLLVSFLSSRLAAAPEEPAQEPPDDRARTEHRVTQRYRARRERARWESTLRRFIAWARAAAQGSGAGTIVAENARAVLVALDAETLPPPGT